MQGRLYAQAPAPARPADGDVGRGGRPGPGHLQPGPAVVDGQGGQGVLVEGLDPAPRSRAVEDTSIDRGRPRAHDPHKAVEDRRVGGQQAPQQRPQGKWTLTRSARPSSSCALGGGHHEQRVRQPAALGPPGGPPRRLGHPGRAGVDPDDQPVRRAQGGQHGAAVTGPEVDGRRLVPGGKVLT